MADVTRESPTDRIRQDRSFAEGRVFQDFAQWESPEGSVQSQDLEAMLDSTPLGLIVVARPHGKITYANRRCKELLGAIPRLGILSDDDRGLRAFSLDGRRLAPAEMPTGQALLKGEVIRKTQMIIEKCDGSRVTVAGSAAPIYGRDGVIKGAMGIFEKVSQREPVREKPCTSEDMLRRRVLEETRKLADARDSLEAEIAARMQLATVVEQTTEGILIAGSDGIITYVNPSVVKNGYWGGARAMGKHVGSCCPCRYESVFPVMWDALQKGDTWAGQMTEVIEEERSRILDVTALPMRDSGRSITAYVAILRDVTGVVELQKRLFQSQRMETLGALAAGIAHDFSNLLTAIIGFTQRALVAAEENPRARDSMGNVLAAGLRARDLVQQILTFSRETSRSEEPVDLRDLIGQTIALIKGSLPSDITIDFRMEDIPDEVWARSSQIHQIIMNLCVNAVQAMKEKGGRLTIRVAPCTFASSTETPDPALSPGNYVKVSVADTGEGMTPEVRARAFDPFFTTRKQGEGTGLGLSVVGGIVANLGGAVTVSSEPGKGSEFLVFLPRAEGKPLTTAGPQRRPTLRQQECPL